MPSPRLTSVADVTQDQAQRTGPKHQCIIGLRQRGSPPYTISARLFLRLALPSPAAGLTWLRANGFVHSDRLAQPLCRKILFDAVAIVTVRRRGVHESAIHGFRNAGVLHDRAASQLHLEQTIASIVSRRADVARIDAFTFHTHLPQRLRTRKKIKVANYLIRSGARSNSCCSCSKNRQAPRRRLGNCTCGGGISSTS